MGSIQKTAIVLGAGGFIGSHLVTRLKREGYHVVGVDLKFPEFSKSSADLFLIGDLRDLSFCERLFTRFSKVDEVYQLAAEMGGAGFIFSGEHDADIMRKSAEINLNFLEIVTKYEIEQIFFASSACIYPKFLQQNSENSEMAESAAYPADPDSEYGWEKLFAERLYLAHAKNYDLDIRIARFHNVYGPEGAYRGGREKVVAALCRKIAEAREGDEVEIWGDGSQTRSFLYIEDCLEGILRLMRSDFSGPVNLGSSELCSIQNLFEMISEIADKTPRARFIDGPIGVQGRNSDNRLIEERLQWKPSLSLREGVKRTYEWVREDIQNRMSRSQKSSARENESLYDFFK